MFLEYLTKYYYFKDEQIKTITFSSMKITASMQIHNEHENYPDLFVPMPLIMNT